MYQALRPILAPSSRRLCPTAVLRPFFPPASLPSGGFCFPTFCCLSATRYYVGSDSSRLCALAPVSSGVRSGRTSGGRTRPRSPQRSCCFAGRHLRVSIYRLHGREVSPGHSHSFPTAPPRTTRACRRESRPLLPRRRGLRHHSRVGRSAHALSTGSLSLRLGRLPPALRTSHRWDALPSATPPKDARRGLDFNRLVVRAAGRTSAAIHRRFGNVSRKHILHMKSVRVCVGY